MGDLWAAGWREKHESIQHTALDFFCWPHGGLSNECGRKAVVS